MDLSLLMLDRQGNPIAISQPHKQAIVCPGKAIYARFWHKHAGGDVKCICLVALLMATPAFAADMFETRLAPSPLNDGTRVNITGGGRASVRLDGNRLSVSGDFHGLATNATSAELYEGAGIAMLGPKAFDLKVTQGTSGTVSGNASLSAKQISALRAGHFYVQVNSQKALDGNLTGWLLPPHPFAGEDMPVAGPGFLPQFDVKP